MDSPYQSLSEAFRDVRLFLDAYQVVGWPERLAELEQEISSLAPENREGWCRFLKNLRLFGGMGALDDIIICRRHGHPVEDEGEANRLYLRKLRGLADAIRAYRQSYGA